jgi:arginine deiminase
MKLIKKLSMWLWTKKRTIDELIKLNEIIDVHNNSMRIRLEELDQNKVYACIIPGASLQDIQAAKEAFNEARKTMRWTMPNIIFLNTEFKEQNKECEKQ